MRGFSHIGVFGVIIPFRVKSFEVSSPKMEGIYLSELRPIQKEKTGGCATQPHMAFSKKRKVVG